MKPELAEVNDALFPMTDFFLKSRFIKPSITREEALKIVEFEKKRFELLDEYNQINDKLDAAIKLSSNQELVIAFDEGNRLFQNLIVAHMCSKFHPDFISALMSAVQLNLPVAHRCIGILYKNNYMPLNNIIKIALNLEENYDAISTSLSIIKQERLKEFYPLLIKLKDTWMPEHIQRELEQTLSTISDKT